MQTRPSNIVLGCLGLVLCFRVSLTPECLCAQIASAKPAVPDSASGVGFSIETEMLTYRALESNSEAIACNIAAYLYGMSANYKNPPSGSVCDVAIAGASTNATVIVLPFDRNVFADFETWRSDLETMAEFESNAHCVVVTPTPPAPRGGSDSLTARGPSDLVASAIASTPTGRAISTAAGVLGLFSTDQASSPVGGTIQDQAFMDEVSNELNAVKVPVLMPTVYGPFQLASLDSKHSPFLIALNKLLLTQACLSAAKAKDDSTLTSINNFINALSGASTPPKSPASTPPPQGGKAGVAADESGNSVAAQQGTASTSHLNAILAADGLAQSLGADDAGVIPNPSNRHILFVKALESGGSVSRITSFFGTKISYSGGSVGTYALFRVDGKLECSGNVYDYAGAIPSQKFDTHLGAYVPGPSKQFIIQRGSCRNPIKP